MAVSTTVINTVARRLRDTANLAYPRAVLVRFVDHAQRVINAYTKSFVTTVTVSGSLLHTFSPLYRIINVLAVECASIETVRLDGKTLNRVDNWLDFAHQDPEWFGTHGNRYISWSTIGKDFFILYPIVEPLPINSSLQFDVVPTIPSTILDNGSNDIVLSDDLIPILQDLVEALGLIKGRRWSEASDPLARFKLQVDAVGRAYQVQDVFGKV